MFEVYEIKTNNKIKVYDVQNDKNGYPKFLIRKGNEWRWTSAKYYSDEYSDDYKHDWEYIEDITAGSNGYKSAYSKLQCNKCGRIIFRPIGVN